MVDAIEEDSRWQHEARNLSRLLAVGGERDSANWEDADLCAMLQEQMTLESAEMIGPPSPQAPEIRTLSQLFAHPRPPLDTLNHVRRYFKRMTTPSDEPSLPPEVARLLYYLTIVAARLRLSQPITRLDDSTLLLALQKQVHSRWLTPETREMLFEAIGVLSGIDAK